MAGAFFALLINKGAFTLECTRSRRKGVYGVFTLGGAFTSIIR